jgi:hypothetical protein
MRNPLRDLRGGGKTVRKGRKRLANPAPLRLSPIDVALRRLEVRVPRDADISLARCGATAPRGEGHGLAFRFGFQSFGSPHAFSTAAMYRAPMLTFPLSARATRV